MDDVELRHRISRLVENEVRNYLVVESEWHPLVRVARTEDTDSMQFVWKALRAFR
jgi:hypothetical protein